MFCGYSLEDGTTPIVTGHLSLSSSHSRTQHLAHEGHTAMVDSKHQFRDTRGTSRAPVSLTLWPRCFLHHISDIPFVSLNCGAGTPRLTSSAFALRPIRVRDLHIPTLR